MKINTYTTIEEIERALKLIDSKLLNLQWADVKDCFEKSHWVTAFNFRLERLFTGEEVGH
jgi:hypothetical protein